MKYGIVTFTAWENRLESQINIGDTIQSLAVMNLYKRMGVDEEDLVKININHLANYDGEYVVLPITLNLSIPFDVVFPMSPKIIPCFIGLSLFSSEPLSNDIKEYLKRYAPIGCRDEATLRLMRENGIEGYLAGCITATFPRVNRENANKIILVDLSDELIDVIPKKVLHDDVKKISHIFHGDKYTSIEETLLATNEVIETYKKEAKLVITSRLHSLSPCIAWGIPVIGLFTNITERMGWIDKLVPLFTVDDVLSIDWNGYTKEYENIKESMIKVAIGKIEETYNKYSRLLDISEFYEDRQRACYGGYYRKMIAMLPKCKDFKYIVWGAGQVGMHSVEAMQKWLPGSNLVGVVDTYMKGTFFGRPIEDPKCIGEKYMDIFLISATYSGRFYVKDYLDKLGKTDWMDFSSVNG